MKTLVLGDIHGRTCWKEIIEKETPDIVVFLGDYVSTHEDISEEQQKSNLEEILSYKEEHPNEVILLRGNHDVQHITQDYLCSGYCPIVGNWMYKNKERFLKNTQWIYEDGDIIFSHAGISQTWFNRHNYDSIEQINEDNCLNNFKFTPCKMSDYHGESETQPPTWIRPNTLLSCAIPNKTYVVGHTPVRKNINEAYEYVSKNFPDVAECFVKGVKVWCCDNLPKEYLVIDNGEFIVKEVENRN